ncbi:MAG: DUF2911 domain-containing protein [Acidobacteria bacterium]|nr:DUF2911 domain-containing protein [Acidobacteriota bacterium]
MQNRLFLIIFLAMTISVPGIAQEEAVRPMLSQKAMTMQRIGLTDITVTYHRPGVKGRVIWGKLVPYNELWRAGANEATTISFSDNVTINGHRLKAGTYSFFVRPTREKWQIIFNSNAEQWGTYFLDKSKNVLTFTVTPYSIPHQEWLLYDFTDLAMNAAKLELRWDNLAIHFTIRVNTKEKMEKMNNAYVRKASEQLAGAALTYLEHHENLKTALADINRAIAIHSSFENWNIKAKILGELKQYQKAISAADAALKIQKNEKNAYTNMEAWQLKRLKKSWAEHGKPDN